MSNPSLLCGSVFLALWAGACAGTTPPPKLSAIDPAAVQAGTDRGRAAPEAVRRLLDAGLDADSAGRIAVLNNPRILALFEEVGVSQARVTEAGRLENPAVEGVVRFASVGGTTTEFALIQNLLDLVARPARKGIAEVELNRTRARLSHEVLSLATRARFAVFELQAEEELLRRLRLVQELTATAAGFAKKQHEAGTLSDLEFEHQQAMDQEGALDVTRSEKHVQARREAVNRLLGLWGEDTGWKLGGPMPALPPTEMDFTGVEELAIRQRQDVAAARSSVDLVGRALALRRKTRFFPAGFHVGIGTEREADGGPRVTGPQFAFRLPIFDTGKASIRRLEAEHRRAQRLLEAAAVDVRSEAREARDAVIASRRLALSYRDDVLPARQRILALTLQRFNAMFAGAYELLLAKRNEVQAEREYVESWRDYWVARATLEGALGGAMPGEPIMKGEGR